MKKTTSIILILCLALTLLSACTKDTNTTSEPLEVKVATPSGAPTLSMIKMFKENPSFGDNVEVSYENIKSADVLASRIISGEVDIAVVPTNLAASLYNKGVEYTLAASTVWGLMYVVGTEEMDSWEDLRGKEIYTFGRGLTPDILFRYLLSNNGIDPDADVTLTYMGEVTELASAFIAGKSNICVIPEPVLSNVMMKKEDTKVLIDLQKEWSKLNGGELSYPQASLIIKNEIIEKNPEFVKKFLEEYEKSINWLSANAETAGDYSEELETGISKAMVVDGLERSNIRFQDSKTAKDEIEKYLKVLMEYSPKSIGGALPNEDFYLEMEK